MIESYQLLKNENTELRSDNTELRTALSAKYVACYSALAAKYCDEHVCLFACVCLSVSPSASMPGTPDVLFSPVFVLLSVAVAQSSFRVITIHYLLLLHYTRLMASFPRQPV